MLSNIQKNSDSINEISNELNNIKQIPGPKGDPGEKGEDGIGISNILQNEDSSLTIKLSDGRSITTIPLKGMDGANGKDGEQGLQGVPGQKGDPGEPGPQGIPGPQGNPGEQGPPGQNGVDGINGQDGYSPIKGEDYWNESDINSIKQYCSDYIDENYLGLLGGIY